MGLVVAGKQVTDFLKFAVAAFLGDTDGAFPPGRRWLRWRVYLGLADPAGGPTAGGAMMAAGIALAVFAVVIARHMIP